MNDDQEIQRLRSLLDAVRPFAQTAIQNLDAYYDVFITYTSNAIEGSTLTHGETALLIEKGITVGGKLIGEHLAAKDHYAAMLWMRDIATSNVALTETVVCNLHRQIVLRDDRQIGGRYADSPRRAQGTGIVYPNPAKIPALMRTFGESLEKAAAKPDTAFDAHFAIASIHPFVDGNGRTARLLMNMVLVRGGYLPLSIGPEMRATYIAALASAQRTGDQTDYLAFMKAQLVRTMTDYVAVVASDPKTANRVPGKRE